MPKSIVLILGFIVAVLMLKYRGQIRDFTGEIGFAERYLGIGGTNRFIIIVAILVFVFSLMYALGTFEGAVTSTVGILFGVK